MGAGVESLDRMLISAQLQPQHERRLHSFDVLQEVDSTNTRLLTAAPPPYGCADVCIAESQYAGRGRRGRFWRRPHWRWRCCCGRSLAWRRCAGRVGPRRLRPASSS